nr:TraR/DksA C4-type zinc finger protein [uncultured Desulfobulbus sp.]
MDEVDYAQDRQEKELRRLITAQAYALPQGESAKTCLECGELIPEERRLAMRGCRFCLRCQEQLERWHKVRR